MILRLDSSSGYYMYRYKYSVKIKGKTHGKSYFQSIPNSEYIKTQSENKIFEVMFGRLQETKSSMPIGNSFTVHESIIIVNS